MAERFERVLLDARVRFRTQTYAVAHGWTTPDFPVSGEAVSDQGWREMLSFFDRTLG